MDEERESAILVVFIGQALNGLCSSLSWTPGRLIDYRALADDAVGIARATMNRWVEEYTK
jgi:hypothetical protein